MKHICIALVGVVSILAGIAGAQTAPSIQPRPNILWITSEDTGPQLGCYGDEYATTPNLDGLASKGMMYLNCWSNAPVCAPARTTIISGMYPPSLGAEHMRSEVKLPPNFKLYPQFLKEHGYYCTNNSKTDYNLETPNKLWDESSNKAHWRKRKAGQPFFAVFNFTVSHESQIRKRPHEAVHDPAKVTVPPYHPDTPEVRRDWAQYYDKVTEMDGEVGQILSQLREDNLDDNTIIFYYGDHGSGMPRSKRWLYQSGLRVPLIVHVPERYRALVGDEYKSGGKNNRLVSFVDLVPTLHSLLGEQPASILQGNAFLGKFTAKKPQYIFGFRGRMDERVDMSRAVRDDRFLYVHNFYPHRPQGTYLDYMFQTPTTQVWQKLFKEGQLNEAQSVFWNAKAAEELYDLEADPYQIKNLAGDISHRETLQRLRGAVKDWMINSCDLGLLPEGEMLDRSGPDAPYTMGHDPKRFDVAKVYEAADLASRAGEDDLQKLLSHRIGPDSAVRYWAAIGLLNLAQQDKNRSEIVKTARGMTNDSSPYVRCAINEIVARWGAEADRKAAIDALSQLANTRENSVFVSVMALNGLDWCQPTKTEIAKKLDGMPAKKPGLSQRYESYVPRLIERIEATAN